jgi:site-specific DNA-cytosine methylase
MTRPDILHASPVCTNASVANSDGEEGELDKATAQKTAQFITVLRPDWFTLENVYPYRNFLSFRIITDALSAAGYSWDYWHVNAADYGVPQTPKRLILIAKLGRGQRVTMPPVTHHNPANYCDRQMTMFEPSTMPWVGWYEAIEDLIPGLPESEFAPWQLKRLPDEVITIGINPNRNSSNDGWIGDSDTIKPNDPYATVVSGKGLSNHRAFIASGALNDNSTSLTTRNGDAQIMTVTTSHNNRDTKAFVVEQANGSHKKSTSRADNQPILQLQNIQRSILSPAPGSPLDVSSK